MFEGLRKRGEIEIRGRKTPLGRRIVLPAMFWYQYVLHEQSDEIEHVRSREILYGVEVRFTEAPDRRRRVTHEPTEIVAVLMAYQDAHRQPNRDAEFPSPGEAIEAVAEQFGASERYVRTLWTKVPDHLKNSPHRPSRRPNR
jgi:hypothetical protein